MLDTGTGLAVFGGFITLSTAIVKFWPAKNGGGGGSGGSASRANGYVSKDVCDARFSALMGAIAEVRDEQKETRRVLLHRFGDDGK